MTNPLVKPLIGVPACVKEINDSPFHAVGDKYLRAIVEAAEGIPMVVPAFGEIFDLPDLVDRLDGLLLTGSPSNVYPTYYDTEPHPKAEPHDRERDATTLPDTKTSPNDLVSIGRVAELCGISVATLRVWERRYGKPVPTRLHQCPDRCQI